MLKYMLDTNIAIYTIKNKPSEVREAFKAHDGQMCISAVTLMELIYGAEASAAAHTGQLRAELKKMGRPIRPYDEMIAGHARSQGLVVVTNNINQFENAPGIRLANWVN
jgi:tRNA(fMet)-specific endonuclease VapC